MKTRALWAAGFGVLWLTCLVLLYVEYQTRWLGRFHGVEHTIDAASPLLMVSVAWNSYGFWGTVAATVVLAVLAFRSEMKRRMAPIVSPGAGRSNAINFRRRE